MKPTLPDLGEGPFGPSGFGGGGHVGGGGRVDNRRAKLKASIIRDFVRETILLILICLLFVWSGIPSSYAGELCGLTGIGYLFGYIDCFKTWRRHS